MTPPIVVIGAGPAGATAAILLAGAGGRVVLVDDAAGPGGRIWPGGAESRPGGPGDRLGRRIAALGDRIEYLPGCDVVSLSDDLAVDVVAAGRLRRIAARAVIAAPGALEIALPVEGWTRLGVIGAAALQVMLKRDGVVPRGPVVLAGAGPLLAVVAADLARAGAHVAALIDAAPFPSPRTLASMVWEPSLLMRALRIERRLRRTGTVMLRGHAIRRIEGQEEAEAVVVGPVDCDWAPVPGPETRLSARTVGLSFGLRPSVETLAVAGARLVHDPALGGHVPARSAACETTVPGLFAIGDGAGVRGVEAALAEAEIVAAALAIRFGLAGSDPLTDMARRAGHRLSRLAFSRGAVGRWWQVRPGILGAVPDSEVVCRCEEATKGEVAAALDLGLKAPSAIKLATRAGMGPCQGRYCLPAIEAMANLRCQSGFVPTPPSLRPPIRPVPVSAYLNRDERR